MTFIITLIALLLERFFHWHHMRHWRWFLNYERILSGKLSSLPPALVLVAIVLPPVLAVGLVQYLVAGWWWGIFEFILGVVVLLYCLGPDNLWVQVYGSMNDLGKEDPAAIGRIQSTFGVAATDNSTSFHQAFVRGIFLASHQRMFAVIFWFVLLGPVGAVLYRVIESVYTQKLSGGNLAGQLKEWLDWLPVRAETLLFALGGHFTAVFACWKQSALKAPSYNADFLTECGLAALDIARLPAGGIAEREALALIDRAYVIGLVILAMGVLVS